MSLFKIAKGLVAVKEESNTTIMHPQLSDK